MSARPFDLSTVQPILWSVCVAICAAEGRKGVEQSGKSHTEGSRRKKKKETGREGRNVEMQTK